jgi:transcription initiation factor TFIID subunit 8
VGADTGWFAAASAAGRCLAGFGVVRDLTAFVNTKVKCESSDTKGIRL